MSVVEPKEDECLKIGKNESPFDDVVVLNSFGQLTEECEILKAEKRAYLQKYKLMKREYEEKLNKCHEKEVQLKDIINVLKHEIRENDKLLEAQELKREKSVNNLEKKLDEALTSEKNLREIVSILENRIAEDKLVYLASKSRSCERNDYHLQNTEPKNWPIAKLKISKTERSLNGSPRSLPVNDLASIDGEKSHSTSPEENSDPLLNLYLHFY